jgi:hypothetical protein
VAGSGDNRSAIYDLRKGTLKVTKHKYITQIKELNFLFCFLKLINRAALPSKRTFISILITKQILKKSLSLTMYAGVFRHTLRGPSTILLSYPVTQRRKVHIRQKLSVSYVDSYVENNNDVTGITKNTHPRRFSTKPPKIASDIK